MALIAVVVGLQALRLADRSVSTVITVTKPVGGTIVGPGIECGTRGSRCSAVLTTGQPLELNTQPDRGYVFAGYTGDCAPTGRTSMSGQRTCGATFERVLAAAPSQTFRLTIMKPERGTVVLAGGILCGTLGTTCSADIPSGVLISLRAEADTGYSWQGFSGDCPVTGEMTMTAAKTCGAAFVQSSAPINAGPVPTAAATRPTPAAPGPALGSAPAAADMPAPAVPSISMEEHAKQEIGLLVRNYCTALATLNPATVRVLFHLDNQNELRQRFREYKSLQCTITSPAEYDRLDAAPAGGAQLKFGMRQVVEMRGGGSSKTLETVVTMVVSRKDFASPWLIDRVFHQEPK